MSIESFDGRVPPLLVRRVTFFFFSLQVVVISETYHLRKKLKKKREREREIVAVLLTHTLLASTERANNYSNKKTSKTRPILVDVIHEHASLLYVPTVKKTKKNKRVSTWIATKLSNLANLFAFFPFFLLS